MKVAIDKKLDLIRRVPLFSPLTTEQALEIARTAEKRRFYRGENVVEQGKKSNALFVLLTGRARVLAADSRGREVTLALLRPGDYVGEMSLIDNEPHSATVRAEVPTDMLVVARAEFARLHASSHERRLRLDVRPGAATAAGEPAHRVARAARRLRQSRRTLLNTSEMVGDVRMVCGKVSRQDLAKVVGASREMVSRVMKDLESRGVLQTQANGWVVLKKELAA